MGFRLTIGAFALLAGAICANGQSAKATPARSAASTHVRLLNADEGRVVLESALETRTPARRSEARSDCSHLVHTIYEKAGFPYTYASSSDLYVGTDDFQRVAQPQAGDVIVWRGHAGVVVNPRHRTFFSALRSGFGVQEYDSPYWKGRGRPHFLRYVQRRPASVLASSNQAVSLKPTGMHSSSKPRISPAITGSIRDETALDEESVDAGDVSSSLSLPDRAMIEGGAQPRAEQVREALLATFRETADELSDRDVLALSTPVVCFDDLKIGKMHRKGDGGSVEVRIVGADSIAEKKNRLKFGDRQRWSLHRADGGNWEVELPGDAVYLPRDLAVRLLARQLAALAQGDGSSREKQAQLARWLDTLLADGQRR